MALTLTEWSKTHQDPLQSSVIEMFARNSPLLERIPFRRIGGNAFNFNRESTLPTVDWYDHGQAYSEGTGTVATATEKTFIMGHDVDIPLSLLKASTNPADDRSRQIEMTVKAAAQAMSHVVLRGDNTANPLQPDGINNKLDAGQVLEAGTDGAQLELAMLDEAIDQVFGRPSLILANRTMRRKINALMRAAGQATETISDAFGRQLQAYAGIPISDIDDAEWVAPLLPFSETQGLDTETCSLYLINFGDDAFGGIETAGMEVRDLGELQTKPVERIRVDWLANPAVLWHPRSVVRIQGVKKPV